MGNSNIFVATQTFNAVVDGQPVLVTSGVTRVREGHQLIKNNPDYFEPLSVQFDVEDTNATPGNKRTGNRRPAKKSADSAKSASEDTNATPGNEGPAETE